MQDQAILERIEAMGEKELDELPLGVITLDLNGRIKRYNKVEAEMARLDQKSQIGKDFFLEVAPCTANPEFQGRFTELTKKNFGITNFDYTFRFTWGAQRVHITFVRKAGSDVIDVLVTRLTTV